MSSWVFRTLIVSEAVVDTCRSLARLLAGEGQNLWTTPLSETGTNPPTHWISSGLIEQQFADLLPLSESALVTNEETQEQTWEEIVISSGQSEMLANSAVELGQDITKEQVDYIFSQCSVTIEEPQTALSRLGLKMVQPEEYNTTKET